MPPRPPSEPVLWDAWFEALLRQHHVDIQRLWKRAPERFRSDWLPAFPFARNAFEGITTSSSTSTSSTTTGTTSGTSTTEELTTVDVSCGNCVIMPECWEITVAGVSNDSGTLCDSYNGTFILEYTPSGTGTPPAPDGCTWRSPSFEVEMGTGCSKNTNAAWELSRSEPNHWALRNKSNYNEFAYVTHDDDWDCDGPNVMDFSYELNNCCTNWPASITISPVACS